jgi:hypothetical protein
METSEVKQKIIKIFEIIEKYGASKSWIKTSFGNAYVHIEDVEEPRSYIDSANCYKVEIYLKPGFFKFLEGSFIICPDSINVIEEVNPKLLKEVIDALSEDIAARSFYKIKEEVKQYEALENMLGEI